MFKIIPLSILLLTAFIAPAQTVITGKVKDNKGKPLNGASIAIKDTYDGGITDSLGNYHFKTSEKGDQTLLITSVGYKLFEQKVTIIGASVKADFVLKEEPNELTAVVITAGTFEASDTKRTTVLNPIDIVTTAGANADITSALKTLPGTQQVGESEGLFVRGGTAEETKVFIDGTLVNNFFYSSVPDIAQRGRFSPFLFKGTVFSSGGYSALYGEALSAALILESVDLPEQSSASVGVSTVGINAGYQQLAKNKKSSWGIDYSYVNLAAYFAVVKQRPDNFHIPEFHNGEFNYRVKTSKTGILKFYGYFNYSRLGVRRPDIDSANLKDAFSLNNFDVYTNLSWKEKIGKKWKMYLGSSYSNNVDKISNEMQNQDNITQSYYYDPYASRAFNVKSTGDLAQVKLVLERKLYGLSAFRFGGEYQHFQDKNIFSNGYVSNIHTQAHDDFTAAFAETDIYITNDLAAKVGGRFEHSALLNRSNVVPRVSLAYKVSQNAQFSLAYGIFFQKPDKTYFIQAYTFNNLMYSKATHYIINYQKVTHDHTLRIEAYYKKYDNLVKTFTNTGSNILTDSLSNGGDGFAKGIELFWRDRKTLKDVDYWISYSYIDSKRNYLNFPYALQPNFVANHTLSVVFKKFVTKWKTGFNGSYTFASGRPYYDLRYDNGNAKYVIADQGTTIAYHNLSFSVNYLPNIGVKSAKKFIVWVFNINNVFGNDQVFGYNYSFDGTKEATHITYSEKILFLRLLYELWSRQEPGCYQQ